MRSKHNPANAPLMRMPSIERNHSSNYMGSEKNLAKESEYSNKPLRNRRYHNSDVDDDSIVNMGRPKISQRNDKSSMSQSIRQTVAGSFRPNDPESIIKNIQVPRPLNDHYSEYDLYNSYGSSNGFSDEKRLSNKMKNKIKASFKYRDEVETAETDSFFSSKFSKFNVPTPIDGQPIVKPNKGIISLLRKNKEEGGSKPTSFPSISKRMPDCNSGSLPSI